MYLNTPCPICHTPGLHMMATTNQWRLYCKVCDKRFNNDLEEMDLTKPLIFPQK